MQLCTADVKPSDFTSPLPDTGSYLSHYWLLLHNRQFVHPTLTLHHFSRKATILAELRCLRITILIGGRITYLELRITNHVCLYTILGLLFTVLRVQNLAKEMSYAGETTWDWTHFAGGILGHILREQRAAAQAGVWILASLKEAELNPCWFFFFESTLKTTQNLKQNLSFNNIND